MGSEGAKRESGSFFRRLRRVAMTAMEKAPTGSVPGICPELASRGIAMGVHVHLEMAVG